MSQEVISAWVAELERASRILKELAETSETEFLAIGGRLHEYFGKAGEIVEMSNRVLGLVSGEEVVTAIAGLHDELRLMSEHLAHADQTSEEHSQRFRTILQLLEKVGQPLAGFKKINKSLSMLGISTKIESSRLGNSAAGFHTLANDVSKLSVQVVDKSDSITKQKDFLSALIRENLFKVVSVGSDQRRSTRVSLEKSTGSLGLLDDINSRCSSAASVISSVSSDVAQNLGEVVTSLQFHDISRQQIEHVRETLDELAAKLREDSRHNLRDLVIEAAHVCELQSAQLEHSNREISTAVGSIIENLTAVVRREEHLSEQTREITGAADKTDSSFFTRMQSDLAQITQALSSDTEHDRKLATAMGEVTGTVNSIYGFVNDIQDIGEEIELIALNAQIKAAHTGSEGAALGVLAEAIQRLSHDTRVQTTLVSEALKGINEFMENLSKGVTEDSSDLETEVRDMVQKLEDLFQALREINVELGQMLSRMNREVQGLSSDISRAVGGITVHNTVDRVVSDAIALLGKIQTEAHMLVPEVKTSSRPLNILAGRYTMHSERKIHAAVTGSGAAAGFGPKAGASEEFGDNVELF